MGFPSSISGQNAVLNSMAVKLMGLWPAWTRLRYHSDILMELTCGSMDLQALPPFFLASNIQMQVRIRFNYVLGEP